MHILEEFVFPGGFGEWNAIFKLQYARVITPSYLFKVNAGAGVLAMLTPLVSFNYRGAYSFMGIRSTLLLLTILGYNTIYHIRGSIVTKKNSPRVFTSVVFYFPVILISYIYFLKINVIDIFSAVICLVIAPLFQIALDQIKERLKVKIKV